MADGDQEQAERISIEHAALWCDDLDGLTHFYQDYFKARPGLLYRNASKEYSSIFLSFGSGARLELMHKPALNSSVDGLTGDRMGYAHLAFRLGSDAAVDSLSERLAKDGHTVVSAPRRTGDGYYESVALDPEGNRVEITA